MNLEVLKEDGTYQPFDVYEDFTIEYTHQYDDYESLSGKKIPYSSKFKIPLTKKNRQLAGIPFDLTYPKAYSVKGRVTNTDGSIAFWCSYEIESQSINILEPYIEITIIDKLSEAINKLSTTEFHEILTGPGTKFSLYEGWIYNAPNNLGYPLTAPFIFPFFNYNNKNVTFAYDPMRNLNQLQPTWIVSNLVKMIFNSVDIEVGSHFLFDNNGIFQGITNQELGLSLPVVFYNDDESLFTAKGKLCFNSTVGTPGTFVLPYLKKHTPIYTGISAPAPSSYKIEVEDFRSFIPPDQTQKMNFQDYTINWSGSFTGITTSEFCSMVDGKLHIKFSKRTNDKPKFRFGFLYNEIDGELDGFELDPANGIVYPNLNCHLVALQNYSDPDLFIGEGESEIVDPDSYDINKSIIVGDAVYSGIESFEGKYFLTYEVNLFDSVEGDFDVLANQRVNIGLVLAQKEGIDFGTQTELGVFWRQLSNNANTAVGNIEFTGAFLNFKNFSSIGSNEPEVQVSVWTDTQLQPFNLEFSFPEPTEYHPATDYNYENFGIDKPYAQIDLAVSYEKYSKKYKLIDIIKMIMSRFNLTMFTKSDGKVYIDTYNNRITGSITLDHLIDDIVTVNYTKGEYGLLTFKDQNPQFYEDNYNGLDKYVVNELYKEEQSIDIGSAIVQSKMFEDVYDDTSYNLLKAYNDSNWWGTSDRAQEDVSSLVPTFCFLKSGDVPVRFPTNSNFKRYSLWQSYTIRAEDLQGKYDIGDVSEGFFNKFEAPLDSSGIFNHKSIAVDTLAGYSLKSFSDNEILLTNTVYNWLWRRSVAILMDNNTVNVDLKIYISPEDFSTLLNFPMLNYYGAQWDMLGINDFPISAQNGGTANIKMSLIEDTYTPEPPLILKSVFVSGSSSSSEDDICGTTPSYIERWFDGAGALPIVNDIIYSKEDGSTVFNGNGRYWKIQGSNNVFGVNSIGVVTSSNSCTVTPPSATVKLLSMSTTSVSEGIACTATIPTITRYHNGAGTYPVNGDTVYTDSLGTTVFVGNGGVYTLSMSTRNTCNISVSGVISNMVACPVNIKITYAFTTDQADACGIKYQFTDFWCSPISVEIGIGDILYTDISLTTPFNGSNRWHLALNNRIYLIGFEGDITDMDYCGIWV